MVNVFLPFTRSILDVATDDEGVLGLAAILVPAMLVGTYVNLLVGNITSGVFSGMGRPLIATILSFGLELPLSIGGVAIYILYYHGDLLGVYWWQAIAGGIEVVIVMVIFLCSNWDKCVDDARRRQEASHTPATEDDEAGYETDGITMTTESESVEQPKGSEGNESKQSNEIDLKTGLEWSHENES